MVRESVEMWVGIEVWHLPEWVTRKEISQACNIAKSPTLIQVLTDLTHEGVLEMHRGVDEFKRQTIFYRITDEYREKAFEEARLNG